MRMGMARHTGQRTGELRLPSGKRVEVVFFEPAPGSGRSTGAELHVCPECDSRLVYPTNWEKAGPKRWSVDLRCPDCEWTGGGVHGEDDVERFDLALDVGTESLLEDLQKLTRANMEDEIERFVAALHSDLVLPEDF
jgi:hypothetical protein